MRSSSELGLEPRRELRELQQAILRQDAALDLAAPSRAARPSRRSGASSAAGWSWRSYAQA